MANTIIKNNGYIIGTAITPFGNDPNANEIEQMLQNPPAAEEGYIYKLKADDLQWELCDMPQETILNEDEQLISETEALSILMGEM